MPSGTCDPASRGASFNEGEFAVDNNAVSVYYRYGWDGVSTRDTDVGCVGPLTRVVVRSSSEFTYYAHFQGRRGQWRRIVLDPGVTRTYNQQQLSNAGFEDNTDLEGLFITRDPNPPSYAKKA